MWASAKLPAVFLAACIFDANLQATLAQDTSCDSDEDCQLISNYCGGCLCQALRLGEELPECPQPLVNCFVDPCSLGQTTTCDGGQCIVVESVPDTSESLEPTPESLGPTSESQLEPTPAPPSDLEYSCNMCQDGSSVPDPDRVLEDFDATCGELEFETQSGTGYYPCSVYQYFGALCGCPNQVPPSNACKLCQDGAGSVTTPDLTLNDSNQTCASLALEADYVTDDIYECGQYHILGNKCGCENQPPDYGCRSLCNDGSPVPDPDLNSFYGVCGDLDRESKFNPYNETCDDGLIAYKGYLCGCDNDPPPGSCGSLCEDGLLPDPERVVFTLGLRCEEIEEISIWDTETSCSDYPLYASLCGCNTTAPEGACGPLCEDGSALPDPELLIFGETCEGWGAMSTFDIRPEACADYKYLGATCGCNNTPPEGACGPLCGENQTLPDGDKVVYGQTCQRWEYDSLFDTYSGEYCFSSYADVAFLCGCTFDLPTDTCGLLCSDGKELPEPDLLLEGINATCRELETESLFDFDGPIEGWCGEYEYMGVLCGCDNPPPEDACLLCDGELEYPDKVSYDENGETYTCQEDAEYYMYTYTSSDEECGAFKSVFGPFCGCAAENPEKACPICSDEEMNTLNIAPEFSYTDAIYGDVTFSDQKCVSAEFLVNLDSMSIDEESCNEIIAQIADDCCEKKEEQEEVGGEEQEEVGGEGGMSPTDPTTSIAHHLVMFTTSLCNAVVSSILLLSLSFF